MARPEVLNTCKLYLIWFSRVISDTGQKESLEILDPEAHPAHLVAQAPPLDLGQLSLDHKDHQEPLDPKDCQGEMDSRCVCQAR